MYYVPMHFPVFMFLVVAFVCYMWKTRAKKQHDSLPFMVVPKNDTSKLDSVLAENLWRISDFVDLYVSEPNEMRVTFCHAPGDQVHLETHGSDIFVRIGGLSIKALPKNYGGAILSSLNNGTAYKAYIYSRDESSTPKWMDFISIVVYF